MPRPSGLLGYSALLGDGSEMSAYQPTLRERTTDFLRQSLFSDDRAGQGKAERLMSVGELLPPVGLANSMYDMGRAGGRGDYLTAGTIGAMAFAPGPNMQKFKAFKGMHAITDEGAVVNPSLGRAQHSWDSGKIQNAGFFGSNPDVASHFADALSRDAMAVFPVDVSFNNPLVIDGAGKHASEFQFGGNKSKWDSYFSAPEFSQYDGVILKNVKDAGGVTDIYVPKDPQQIAPGAFGKSAQSTMARK